MPLKLLQFDRSPFLYSTLMVASFHSCGISPPFHPSTKMETLPDDGLIVAVDLEQFGGKGVVANRPPVPQPFRCRLNLLGVWSRRQASGGARRWSLRHLFDDIWVQGGGLGVQEGY